MIKTSSLLLLASLSPLTLLACGSGGSSPTGGGGAASTTGTATTTSSSTAQGGAGGAGGESITVGPSTGTGGSSCVPPEVLITLDRTLTMHKTPEGAEPTDAPNYESSKWFQALTALKALVVPPKDKGIHFGLEMWPKDPGGCLTLAERVMGMGATNPSCQEGEVLVPPAESTSGKIAPLLDPKTAHICTSTPTGQGLLTASDYLKAHQTAGHAQYIMLVTDGADWDQSCPTPDPLVTLQQIAKGGIKSFVVGFSATGDIQPGGTGAPFLNDMACAGMTAKGFPDSCVETPDGYKAKDSKGATLYLQASDGAALSVAFNGIAAELCCDCAN